MASPLETAQFPCVLSSGSVLPHSPGASGDSVMTSWRQLVNPWVELVEVVSNTMPPLPHLATGVALGCPVKPSSLVRVALMFGPVLGIDSCCGNCNLLYGAGCYQQLLP